MSKIQKYEGKETTVFFDAARCIHAGHCVHGLPDVFRANAKGPWINPDACDAETLAKLIESCPSGALRYETERTKEATPAVNTVSVEKDGPLTIHADYTLNGEKPDSPRTTLCRCGASKIKPYCDGSHSDAGFTDDGEVTVFNPDEKQASGSVEIKTLKDGPLYLVGPHSICDSNGKTARVCAKSALCRCGASNSKPYCDGSHAGIGFKSE
ncbi:iron-binding zinc finger CDGSH type [Mariprofundus micogutta]|uniref:Iron-binding zinc finger CDGSH type n=1 Tax=Mariprofundus micogutta TaxID=1921010 RepID=A0A1L8CQN7_9PROT|nr:CDGSH iron-sulfur domain-containing protein [Mariprofundus micogutta]GAV21231.1 iron-binding zinc finger CDGSH type [Mariprofundus micogutta]